jgi:hypothetical protein
MAVPTALLSAALAGLDGTAAEVRVSGRTETSAVAFEADDGAPRHLAAIDVLPRVGLLLDRKTLRLALTYEPQLRVSQVLSYPGNDAALVHGASARAEWDLDPRWRATGVARSSRRLLDFVASSGGELSRLLDMRAPPTAVRYHDDGAWAGIEGRPTRRATVASTVAMDWSGGTGADGRAAMPRMRELRLAGSVARAQSRQDVVRIELAASSANFEAGAASLATLSAGWTREATRRLRLRVAAGASEVLTGSAPADVMPGGEAEVDATPALLGRPLRARVALRAGPAFDRFGARVQEQIGIEGLARWALTPRWSVAALAATGRVAEQQGYSASRADLRAEWRASPRVTLYAHLWSERHHDPRLAAGTTASYLGTSFGVELAPAAR